MSAFFPVGGLGGGGGTQDAIDGILSVEVDDSSAGQSLGTTPAKVTWFEHAAGSGVTASASTDDLTIVTSGRYDIAFSCSGAGPASSVTWAFEARVDGARPAAGSRYGATRTTAVTALGAFSFVGQLDLTAGQKLTLWGEASGTQTFAPSYCALKITRAGA